MVRKINLILSISEWIRDKKNRIIHQFIFFYVKKYTKMCQCSAVCSIFVLFAFYVCEILSEWKREKKDHLPKSANFLTFAECVFWNLFYFYLELFCRKINTFASFCSSFTRSHKFILRFYYKIYFLSLIFLFVSFRTRCNRYSFVFLKFCMQFLSTE